MEQPARTRLARDSAETALVRVVHHYGSRPEFVLLGGLVPELLCERGPYTHVGTTDVDVQVNLEIAAASANMPRLENALRNAEFEPDPERAWRWRTIESGANVKFELLADLEDVKNSEKLVFDDCEALGAVNLRGTGYAARDVDVRILTARIGDLERTVEMNVAGLGGFLLAKVSAARERRAAKDWYDIAFVLLHNDRGGPEQAARRVREKFERPRGPLETSLIDLQANFETPSSQGSLAYVAGMREQHPELDSVEVAADAVTSVQAFVPLVLQD